MHRRTDAALASVGITADQFVVLSALTAGDTLTQRELVERTNSDPNTLRAMLVLLERLSLVERTPHPTDRRARSVALTRRGRDLQQRAWRASQRLREVMAAPFSDREMATVTQQLADFAAALQPTNTSASGPSGRPRVRSLGNSSSYPLGVLP